MTPEEMHSLKTDVEVLKVSTNQVINAISESVDAQKENSKLITELVIEMRQRDVRDEYRQKDFNDLKGHISRVDVALTDYIEKNHTTLDRIADSQKLRDNFINSITSTWGKIFAGLLVAAMAYLLGVDLTTVFKTN